MLDFQNGVILVGISASSRLNSADCWFFAFLDIPWPANELSYTYRPCFYFMLPDRAGLPSIHSCLRAVYLSSAAIETISSVLFSPKRINLLRSRTTLPKMECNPLSTLLIQFVLSTMVMAFTNATWLVRLAILPLVATCTGLIIQNSMAYMTRTPWAALLGGYSISFFL
jgi:hypothetical protein